MQAIDDELGAVAAKRAPPPAPPVVAEVDKFSPANAARRAAEIAADPRFWDPRLADKDGVRLTAEQHGRLVQERSELLARAAEAK
jgi:hypothetical protein